MFNLDPLILSLAVALGIGLLIGTERERRKGTGPQRSAAGLFTLASLIGASSPVVRLFLRSPRLEFSGWRHSLIGAG
jgi:uncharacterized membrane protein YhiD involved in acid resistance